MSDLKPFIFWFGFEEVTDDESDIHFYQTIILGSSIEEVFSWGNALTKEFVKKKRAQSIHSSWVEEVIPELITHEGTIALDWPNVSRQELEQYYQGTATSKNRSDKNINAFIFSDSEVKAKKRWNQFLLTSHPDFKIETCTKPAISITKVGIWVDWLNPP